MCGILASHLCNCHLIVIFWIEEKILSYWWQIPWIPLRIFVTDKWMAAGWVSHYLQCLGTTQILRAYLMSKCVFFLFYLDPFPICWNPNIPAFILWWSCCLLSWERWRNKVKLKRFLSMSLKTLSKMWVSLGGELCKSSIGIKKLERSNSWL